MPERSARILLTGAILGVLPAAWLGPRSFAGYVALVVAGLVLMALPEDRRWARAPGALTAALYLFLAGGYGEAGILWATGIGFVLLAGLSVFRGLRPDSLNSLARSVLAVSYLGSFGSYFVLIRGLEDGTRMIWSLALMIIAFQLTTVLVRERLPARSGLRASQLRAKVAGAVVCVGVAMAARWLLELDLGLFSTAVLGLVVAMAATLGQAAARLASEDLYRDSRIAGMFEWLNGLLFAAPALFYTLRLSLY